MPMRPPARQTLTRAAPPWSETKHRLVVFACFLLFISQRTHDVITTSLLRQNDVTKSVWRNNDVIIMSRTRWIACATYDECAHMCSFLLQSRASWDMGPVHSGICATTSSLQRRSVTRGKNIFFVKNGVWQYGKLPSRPLLATPGCNCWSLVTRVETRVPYRTGRTMRYFVSHSRHKDIGPVCLFITIWYFGTRRTNKFVVSG